MHFQCRSFIGKTSDSSWSQFWENEPDDLLVFRERGHLFGLISLQSTTTSASLSQTGHDFINTINSNYFDSTFVSINQNLTESLANISTDEDIRMLVVVFVVHQSRLYLAIKGSGSAHIVRGSTIANILDNYSRDVKSISGPLLPDDTIFVASADFVKIIPWDEIKKTIKDTNLQTIEENFMSLLYNSNGEANSSAIIVKVISNPEIDTPAEPEPVVEPVTEPTIAPPVIPKPFTNRKSIFSLLGRLKFFRRDIIVSSTEFHAVTKRKKTNLLVATLLLIGLFSSIIIGYQKKKDHDLQKQFESLKTELESKINNANTVRNLNLDTARQLADQSNQILAQIENLGVKDFDASSFRNEINSILTSTGATDSSAQDAFYSLNLISDQPAYTRLAIKNDLLYLLDNTANRIDVLNTSKKSYDKLTQDKILSDVRGIFVDGSNIFAYDNKSLYLLGSDNHDAKFDFSKISDTVNIVSAGSWNGSIYLLDSSKPTIWKLTPNSNGFSHHDWITGDKKPTNEDLSLAINGKIWTLSTSGSITPYLRGVKENYPKPADLNTSSARGLVTTAEGELLAFFDDNNNIYVYTKEGKSHSRYSLGSQKILDIQMSSDSTTIYALTQDQKIFSFKL